MGNLSEKDFYTIIKNRKEVKLNGVLSVKNFTDDYLELNCELGDMIVEGKELKIESLIKESGEIIITGKIDSVYYKEKAENRSFWSKIFKWTTLKALKYFFRL